MQRLSRFSGPLLAPLTAVVVAGARAAFAKNMPVPSAMPAAMAMAIFPPSPGAPACPSALW